MRRAIMVSVMCWWALCCLGATSARAQQFDAIGEVLTNGSPDAVAEALLALNTSPSIPLRDVTAVLAAVDHRTDLAGDHFEALVDALRCWSQMLAGNLEQARKTCEAAVDAAERDANPRALFAAHRQSGKVALEAQDVEAGISHLLTALAGAEGFASDRGVVVVYSAMALLAQTHSAFAEAAHFLELALARAERMDDPSITALIANNLGALFLLKGEPQSAVAPYATALAAVEQMDGGTLPFAVRAGAALARGRNGEPAKARARLQQLIEQDGDDVARVWLGIAYHFLGDLDYATGDFLSAERHADQSLEILSIAPTRIPRVMLLSAKVHAALGRHDAALETLDELVAVSADSPRDLQLAYETKATLLEEMDRPGQALVALRAATAARDDLVASAENHQLQITQGRFEVEHLRRDLAAAARANRAQQRWSTSLGVLMGVSLLMLLITVLQFARHRQLQAALDAKLRLEALGRLTGGVAHDFNNMLTVIRQSIDLLRTKKLGDDAQAILDEAAHATATAGTLVRRLLDFSRGRESELQEIELTPYLERSTPLLRRTAGEGIVLQVEGEPDVRVQADEDQLTAVLINLVANARDAMDGTGTVVVRAWQQHSHSEERVAISVSDTGKGISTTDRTRVFEPFFTTKGEAGGVGLGLSMVFGLIKGWGGEIDLQSEVGSGTVITLWLRSA